MSSREDIIQEITLKYNALEAAVNSKLQNIRRKEMKLKKLGTVNTDALSGKQSPKILSYDQARSRNFALIKSLEASKARLRSLSTYSPLEDILKKARENYVKDIKTVQCNNVKKKS